MSDALPNYRILPALRTPDGCYCLDQRVKSLLVCPLGNAEKRSFIEMF